MFNIPLIKKEIVSILQLLLVISYMTVLNTRYIKDVNNTKLILNENKETRIIVNNKNDYSITSDMYDEYKTTGKLYVLNISENYYMFLILVYITSFIYLLRYTTLLSERANMFSNIMMLTVSIMCGIVVLCDVVKTVLNLL